MVEYEKIEEIPIIERNFKVTDETKEIAEILKGVEVGESLKFSVNGNQPEKDARRESNKLKGRVLSATRLVGYGRYKVVTRYFDVYVKRLD